MRKLIQGLFILMVVSFIYDGNIAYAKSAREIDVAVEEALDRFKKEIPGGNELLKKAKGMLILPGVVKAGFGVGGEYGEGSLIVGGKNAGYYNTIGGSLGFQIGAQVKDIYLLFMNRVKLQQFINSDGWEAGVDGSLAVIQVGANGSLDTTQTNQPVLTFVLSQKGLMYNLTLEGSKFNKIEK